MNINPSNRRKIGQLQEYPGATIWPDYEYRCPECGKWHGGSDVSQTLDDGTESYVCNACIALIDWTETEQGNAAH